MTDVLESSLPVSPETADGGFSIPHPGQPSPDVYDVILQNRPDYAQVANAKAQLDALLAQPGIDDCLMLGKQDVIASRESGRRDSENAKLYAYYESLLGVANTRYDRVPSSSISSAGHVAIGGCTDM